MNGFSWFWGMTPPPKATAAKAAQKAVPAVKQAAAKPLAARPAPASTLPPRCASLVIAAEMAHVPPIRFATVSRC